MIYRSMDRRRSTQGGLAASFGAHAVLMLLLLYLLRSGPVQVLPEEEELTRISYIEARYGEDVAAKVKIKKALPKSAGRGVETRSAVKPKVESPAKVESKPASGIEDVQAPKLEPKKQAPSKPAATQRLASRQIQRNSTPIVVPDAPERKPMSSVTAASRAPSLQSKAPRESFQTPQSSLVDRGRSIDVGGTGADLAPGRSSHRAVEDVAATPSLQSRGSGGDKVGYRPPAGGLSSRGGDRGSVDEGDGGGIVPPSGGSRGSGRRTVLDYGSGGGGLTGRRGGGGLSEPTRSEDIVGTKKPETTKQVTEAKAELKGKGTNMTITGQIAGRKILKSVLAEYTTKARRNGWEGAVAVHFTVLPDGRVKDNVYFEQTSAHRDLNQAAMKAIKQFRFAPLGPDKAAVEQWGVITIVFRLN